VTNSETHMSEIRLDQWTEIRSELRRRLIQVAKRNRTITYTDLAVDLPFEGPHSHALSRMLEEIGQECHAESEPLLSALAVYATGDKQGDPGEGFYGALVRLKLLSKSAPQNDRYEFWVRQVSLCHSFTWP